MDIQIAELSNGFTVTVGATSALFDIGEFETLIEEGARMLREREQRAKPREQSAEPERVSSYVVSMAQFAIANGVCPECSGAMIKTSDREGSRWECPTHG